MAVAAAELISQKRPAHHHHPGPVHAQRLHHLQHPRDTFGQAAGEPEPPPGQPGTHRRRVRPARRRPDRHIPAVQQRPGLPQRAERVPRPAPARRRERRHQRPQHPGRIEPRAPVPVLVLVPALRQRRHQHPAPARRRVPAQQLEQRHIRRVPGRPARPEKRLRHIGGTELVTEVGEQECHRRHHGPGHHVMPRQRPRQRITPPPVLRIRGAGRPAVTFPRPGRGAGDLRAVPVALTRADQEDPDRHPGDHIADGQVRGRHHRIPRPVTADDNDLRPRHQGEQRRGDTSRHAVPPETRFDITGDLLPVRGGDRSQERGHQRFGLPADVVIGRLLRQLTPHRPVTINQALPPRPQLSERASNPRFGPQPPDLALQRSPEPLTAPQRRRQPAPQHQRARHIPPPNLRERPRSRHEKTVATSRDLHPTQALSRQHASNHVPPRPAPPHHHPARPPAPPAARPHPPPAAGRYAAPAAGRYAATSGPASPGTSGPTLRAVGGTTPVPGGSGYSPSGPAASPT